MDKMNNEQFIKLREDNAVIKETLKNIHEQTIKTNGRMTKAEEDIQKLQQADIRLKNEIERNSENRKDWKNKFNQWSGYIVSGIIGFIFTLLTAYFLNK